MCNVVDLQRIEWQQCKCQEFVRKRQVIHWAHYCDEIRDIKRLNAHDPDERSSHEQDRAKWVPKLLSDEQQIKLMECSKEFLKQNVTMKLGDVLLCAG